jgi:hypothetical protein
MDPKGGRFASVDPFQGFDDQPMSLHRYLYANSSPIYATDPSGQFSISEINAVLAIRGELIGHYFNTGLGFNDAANGESAEKIANGVLIGAAFAVGIPVFGAVAKLLLPRANQILKVGGWLQHHEGANCPQPNWRHKRNQNKTVHICPSIRLIPAIRLSFGEPYSS